MFNLFRNGLSAVAIILVFTVAACCPPCEPTETCPGPSEEPSADMEMDDMGMPTKACALVYLTANDPKPPLYSGIGSAHFAKRLMMPRVTKFLARHAIGPKRSCSE